MTTRRALVAALAAAAVASCSGGASPSNPRDAGTGGSPDASSGAAGTAGIGGLDGSSSGSAGAGGSAAGAAGAAGQTGDSGLAWWDDGATQWKPVPWAPCDIEYATDPAAAAPPLDWKACAGGPPGCEELDPAWPPDVTFVHIAATVTRTATGHRMAAVYFASGPSSGYLIRTVLYDEASNAVAAIRSKSLQCDVDGAWVSGDQTCLMISDVASSNASVHFACGAGTAPVTAPHETASLGVELPFGTFSGEILAMVTMSPKINEVLDVAAGQFHNLVAPIAGYDTYDPYAVGSDVVMRASTGGGHAVAELWKRPDTTLTLIDPAGSRSLADVRSDGQSLVWIEADTPYDAQGNYPHGYLYASPFAETASAVKPKLIRDLPTDVSAYMPAVADQGYYLIHRVVGRLDLFRISDGHHWTMTAPSGLEPCPAPVGVDATYAFYGANKPGIGQAKIIVRQRLDALGPGD